MKRLVCSAWVLLLAIGMTAHAAFGEISGCDAPKVDNFVVFVDQSGSMYQRHAEVGEVKELLVKRTLLELNEDVPGKFCCLNSAIYLFAPFDEVKAPYVYDRESMATRIGWIPDGQPVALRLTPMADGFEELTPVVHDMKGKTAVIVFTDGGANTGGDAVEAARALVAATPGTCLHVVSFADSDAGREVNQGLAKVTPECRSVEGRDVLGNNAAMQQFARDVFCKTLPPPARRGG